MSTQLKLDFKETTSKNSQMICSFQKEMHCKKGEAIFFLSLSNWEYRDSCAIYILQQLERLRKSNVLNQRSFQLQERLTEEGTNERKRKPKINKENKQSNGVQKGGLGKKRKTELNQNLFSIPKQLKKEQGTFTFEKLKKFLTQYPSPGWKARVWAFKLYNKTLVQGFPENLKTKEPIIFNKELFHIYVSITNKVSVKNLQRGVHAYLSKFGYHNETNHNHKFMIFKNKF
ncbi:hypothetical protein M0813_25429 [Anaeramoeba flamelloides]|uniref:Uncharacterized protein n=1 Tax=Anaeramoeba flamelloides TaxID=1746091 RepID=A0AAV7YJX9_9EUKA|nr:hypothetical protein M0812_23078 [Anaeramoeba flamelloides]KAJ6239217.1 hypothetical protein M0813_25429 [Anaeramoeba flamelloides]